jgi:hypothetical protein
MSKIDVDTLSAELTHDIAFSKLEKMLPPKLRYRFYKWLKQFGRHTPVVAQQQQVKDTVHKAINHFRAVRELKKNEVMTSVYDNGLIRMDFGGSVDRKVKDAAMSWAKKRGLKAVEASIEKSNGASSHIVFGNAPVASKGVCLKYTKYSF